MAAIKRKPKAPIVVSNYSADIGVEAVNPPEAHVILVRFFGPTKVYNFPKIRITSLRFPNNSVLIRRRENSPSDTLEQAAQWLKSQDFTVIARMSDISTDHARDENTAGYLVVSEVRHLPPVAQQKAQQGGTLTVRSLSISRTGAGVVEEAARQISQVLNPPPAKRTSVSDASAEAYYNK